LCHGFSHLTRKTNINGLTRTGDFFQRIKSSVTMQEQRAKMREIDFSRVQDDEELQLASASPKQAFLNYICSSSARLNQSFLH
jgi:hypothetical protein